MALTFVCGRCGNRRFFSSYVSINEEKICNKCQPEIERGTKLREEKEEQKKKAAFQIKKQQQKKEKEKKANLQLKQQLEKEKAQQQYKEKKALERKKKLQQKKIQRKPNQQNSLPNQKNPLQNKRTFQTKNNQEAYGQTISISLEQEAEELSKKHQKVLYVFADMKHIRVVEWVAGRKRVALNKTRELRRTHKGGFSQEKFQKFIDMKKKKTREWVEENLKRQGVLRGSYGRVVVDVGDKRLDSELRDILDRIFNKYN